VLHITALVAQAWVVQLHKMVLVVHRHTAVQRTACEPGLALPLVAQPVAVAFVQPLVLVQPEVPGISFVVLMQQVVTVLVMPLQEGIQKLLL